VRNYKDATFALMANGLTSNKPIDLTFTGSVKTSGWNYGIQGEANDSFNEMNPQSLTGIMAYRDKSLIQGNPYAASTIVNDYKNSNPYGYLFARMDHVWASLVGMPYGHKLTDSGFDQIMLMNRQKINIPNHDASFTTRYGILSYQSNNQNGYRWISPQVANADGSYNSESSAKSNSVLTWTGNTFAFKTLGDLGASSSVSLPTNIMTSTDRWGNYGALMFASGLTFRCDQSGSVVYSAKSSNATVSGEGSNYWTVSGSPSAAGQVLTSKSGTITGSWSVEWKNPSSSIADLNPYCVLETNSYGSIECVPIKQVFEYTTAKAPDPNKSCFIVWDLSSQTASGNSLLLRDSLYRQHDVVDVLVMVGITSNYSIVIKARNAGNVDRNLVNIYMNQSIPNLTTPQYQKRMFRFYKNASELKYACSWLVENSI